MTTIMRGTALAEQLRARVKRDVERLADADVMPTLGTVLMTADPAARSYMDRKHAACADLGIETTRVDVDPTESATALYRAVETLADDDAVTALFVQTPLPDHVDSGAVRERIPPSKDVDCFAPENLGRLVSGVPSVTPATTAAVLRLLDGYGVETAGKSVVIVGRTTTIGKPLANALLAPDRDATVTVCHSRTRDLAEKTRRAEVLVTAAGEAGLVDETMVSPGVSVVDISVNRVGTNSQPGYDVVGDVAFERVRAVASAITPVPGGVGPLTMSSLLRNVVDVTARAADVDTVVDNGS